MSFCCCGNLRSKTKLSKTPTNAIKAEKNVTENDELSQNNNVEKEPCTDKVINEHNLIEDVFIENQKKDSKVEFVEPYVESDIKSTSKVRDGRSLSLKSVLHRNIRFDDDTDSKLSLKYDKPFVASSRRGSLYIFRNADDIIITPFAQILACLKKVRANFMLITNIRSKPGERDKMNEEVTIKVESKQEHLSKDSDSAKKIATETLNELEWCLDRLENIQTHRSVSDMASTKFKQIINRELSQYAETSKSGHQISDYICKTFLDSPLDDNMPKASSVERVIEETDDCRRNELSKYGPKLTKVNTEPVLKHRDLLLDDEPSDLKETETVNNLEDMVPLLGVDVPKEEDVIEIINQNLLKWGMDLFNFAIVTGGHPLVVISYAIFKHHNLINKFQINTNILVQFLINVENSYQVTVPYHNSIHAADVTQSANVLLNGPALDNVFSDLEILSVIFACIVHDMDHPGVTNQYLINTSSDLATLYNDSSVLENHHLAMAFTLLANKQNDFLTELTRRQKQSMRRMVIDMVLATDMSKHMTLLADLKTMVETKKVAGSGILTLDAYTDRIQILQNLVHCSDLSNPTKPLELYQTWTERIMEEFYLQGDKERSKNLEISPMCDRETATVEKSQVSFIDFIVHPLWETWSELVYPDSQGILDNLEENRQWYFNISQEKVILSED